MSAEKLLRRSSFDSSFTLHGNDDSSGSLPSPLERSVLDFRWPSKDQSWAISKQYVRYVLTFGRVTLRSTAFLLPSFIRSWKRVDSTEKPYFEGKQALSALNGLRGVACLIVFCYHLLFVWTHSADISWGTVIDTTWFDAREAIKYQDNDQKSLLQLPILRLLYAGHSMVMVFFVISGYVLSHKPLKLLRGGKYEELQRVLSSSVFRRGIRLFGPTVIATFITMLFTNAGYFEAGKSIRTDTVTYKGANEEHPILFPTFHEQISDWVSSLGYLVSNVWSWDIFFGAYDPHLWTIPLEFRSSMVLFITLLGLSRLRPLARLVLMFNLVGLCLVYWARWEVFLFLAGMIIAELDIVSGIFTGTPILDGKESSRCYPSCSWLWWGIMLVGLFLNSCPSSQPQNAPGYMYLAAHVPKSYDWQPGRPFQAIGGCLVVWSFMHLPRVQRIFTTAVAQYLGQISYAFYIVHGPILHGFGYNLVLACWSLTGKETDMAFASGLGLAALVILPLAIWVADLFWRIIDAPFVKLAKWVEIKLSLESKDR